MQIFDFSDIQNNGIRINQLRLFHTISLRSSKVEKLRMEFRKNEDIAGEKRLIISHLVEIVEIRFTLHYLFAGLMFLFMFLVLVSLFFQENRLMFSMIFLIASFMSYRLAAKFREDFVMGSVGIDMTESIYNGMINEKYNKGSKE